MLDRRAAALLILSGAVAASTLDGAEAAELKAPDQVKTALRLMMQVVNDFDRQITRKTYARLPHENMEFQEACGALTAAVAADDADFKASVGRAVKQALSEAQKVADASSGGDAEGLRAGHARLLKSVNAVFALFPPALRPDPNVQPGGRPAPPHA